MRVGIAGALGGVLLGGVLLTGMAHAATISSFASFDWRLTELNPVKTLLSVDGFDSSLGTLNSATLTLKGWLTSGGVTPDGSDGIVTYTGEEASFITATVYGWKFDAKPEDSSLGSALTIFSGWNVITSNEGTVASGGTLSMPSNTISKTVTKTYTSGLDSFLADDLTYRFSTTIGQFSLGSGGNVDWSVNTYAKAELEVVYGYTPQVPVPEPATILLFGIGVLGAAGISRRKSFRI